MQLCENFFPEMKTLSVWRLHTVQIYTAQLLLLHPMSSLECESKPGLFSAHLLLPAAVFMNNLLNVPLASRSCVCVVVNIEGFVSMFFPYGLEKGRWVGEYRSKSLCNIVANTDKGIQLLNKMY